MTKTCYRCKKRLNGTKFHKNNHNKNKLCYICKLCIKIRDKQKYLNNKDSIKAKEKEYRLKNKINIYKRKRINYIKNKQKIITKITNYQRNRLRTDINFKLSKYLRNRIYYALKRNFKSKRTLDLLGCSLDFLKQHLEKQFGIGMKWSNYGKWHIDHIRPCASFDLSKPKEQRKCFHYTNLQPLWANENIKKGSR